MTKRFQKTIFVKIEGDHGEEYLNAAEDVEVLVTTSEKVKIGIYQLVEVREAKGTVQLKKSRCRVADMRDSGPRAPIQAAWSGGSQERMMDNCQVNDCQKRLLVAALEDLIRDINDYEKANNLVPNPGRMECWDSVARAKLILRDM